MSDQTKRGAKTVPVSLRLDPKTKFMLDFVARIKGQTITTVVERAIKDMADKFSLSNDEGNSDNKMLSKWCDFWCTDEGTRTILLVSCKRYPTTFGEDQLKEFVTDHCKFFYSDDHCGQPNQTYIDVLWPNIDRYLDIWHETKSSDHWRAGRAMKADLAAAGVAGPNWPPASPIDEEIASAEPREA